MSVESRLRDSLLAAAGVSTAIGTRLSEYPKRQGGAYPCAQFLRVSTVPDYTHDGRGNIGWSRFQVDVLAQDPEAARSVADLLVAALPTFNLLDAITSPATVYTESPNQLLNRWQDLYSETEPIIYRTGLEFKIWHRE